MPSVFRASLENIFIALLFHFSHTYGTNTVLAKVIDEIQHLEYEGIEINEAV